MFWEVRQGELTKSFTQHESPASIFEYEFYLGLVYFKII